jgi:transcriptional regulator with GAF, ATPase, and Fis domain
MKSGNSKRLVVVTAIASPLSSPARPAQTAYEQLEREVVVMALERNGWNQTAAAGFLRIPRHTLIYRIEKYDIAFPATK